MPAAVNFDMVREIALGLPDVEETTTYGAPAFKVHGTLVACPATNRSAEPNTLVVRVPYDQRAALLDAEPDVYYLTDHYVNYPTVLVRMARIRRDALTDLLSMAWHFALSTPTKRRKKTSPGRRRR